MAHLFVALTAHGYGHLAQIAPVLAALRARCPELRISLQSNLNPAILRDRLPPKIHLIPHAADVALPMDGPLKVRWQEGLQLYQAFDADYPQHLAQEIARLEAARPDLVLANIPWLPLDAARRLGIPAVGLCSLNWLDILTQSPLGARIPEALADRLRSAYAGAELFIRPTPSMPMDWLPNARAVGPIAEVRARDSQGLRVRLGLDDDQRLILMQFGGTGTLHIDPRPLQQARLHLLTADPQVPESPAVSRIATPNGIRLLDALASCDAMITKPGYGSFAEAACHGIPVLSVPRDDWPETPPLLDWLRRQVPTNVITPEQLADGQWVAPLMELLEQSRQAVIQPVLPDGIGEALDWLLSWLEPDVHHD